MMIASEKFHQDISEAMLSLLAPCEGITKFRHSLLAIKTPKSTDMGLNTSINADLKQAWVIITITAKQ